FPEVAAELQRRHRPRHRQGFTVFLSGLSGAGKSTIANALLVKFLEMGGRPVTLLDGDIEIGIVGVLLTIAVGSLGHTVGSVIATATTATLMSAIEDGDEISTREAYRRTGPQMAGLLRGLVRAVVFVGLLLVSVVGIPWGLRQLIRYQFLGPVVGLEGIGGQPALDRSSGLVRGHWFHVAGVVLLLNGVVWLVNAVVGLLLLLLLSGIPLWLFSVIVTVFAALVVPYASIGLVLLYGDAVAQRDGIDVAEKLEPAGGARAE
ncbi:MAG: adenylyl-sulfate kinase, partial [Acidimicrobiales bacterium]